MNNNFLLQTISSLLFTFCCWYQLSFTHSTKSKFMKIIATWETRQAAYSILPIKFMGTPLIMYSDMGYDLMCTGTAAVPTRNARGHGGRRVLGGVQRTGSSWRRTTDKVGKDTNLGEEEAAHHVTVPHLYRIYSSYLIASIVIIIRLPYNIIYYHIII